MRWDLGFHTTHLFESDDLLVAEFHCHGEKRPWSFEQGRYFELGLQRSGGHLREVGRERGFVGPDTVTLSKAGDEFRIASPSDHPQTSTLILVRGPLERALAPRVTARLAPLSAPGAILYQRLVTSRSPLELQEAALELLTHFAGDVTEEGPKALEHSPPASRRRLVEEAEHVLATRAREPLSVQVIADACRVSPFHLCRVFRAVTGETIHTKLTRVRLRLALAELPGAAGDLTSLALRTGFSSHSHFTAAFRREYGTTPSSLVRARSERRAPLPQLLSLR